MVHIHIKYRVFVNECYVFPLGFCVWWMVLNIIVKLLGLLGAGCRKIANWFSFCTRGVVLTKKYTSKRPKKKRRKGEFRSMNFFYKVLNRFIPLFVGEELVVPLGDLVR